MYMSRGAYQRVRSVSIFNSTQNHIAFIQSICVLGEKLGLSGELLEVISTYLIRPQSNQDYINTYLIRIIILSTYIIIFQLLTHQFSSSPRMGPCDERCTNVVQVNKVSVLFCSDEINQMCHQLTFQFDSDKLTVTIHLQILNARNRRNILCNVLI